MASPQGTNQPAAKLLVLTGERFACIKIVGRANFNSSIDFRTLLNGLRQKGLTFFVLDLSECVLMDSTFLGVLAGLGLKMNLGGPGDDGRQIELYEPNPRIRDLLENLGILNLFRICQGPLKVPEGAACAYEAGSPSKEELTRACLEAHRTLMEIHPQNVSKFKEVTRFLAEDLERLKAKS